MMTRSILRTSRPDIGVIFSSLARVMVIVPTFIALGALVGSMLLVSLSMANLLPAGADPTLQGLIVALELAVAAMVWDRLARRYQVNGGTTPESLKRVRTALFIAAFAAGAAIPAIVDIVGQA